MGYKQGPGYKQDDGDSLVVRWGYWDNQLAKAKREGVIEGLEIALDVTAGTLEPDYAAIDRVVDAIRAELKRLRAEQKEG